MHRHPSTQVNSDGTNFTFWLHICCRQPYTCKAFFSSCLDSKFCQSSNNRFFQESNIFMNVGKKFIHIKNRITYQLPWSMKSNISTSVDFKKFDFLFFQLFFVQKQVVHFSTFPQSVNCWM